jgi:glycosyltransferase involved in cell wall biosynthesis
MGGIETIVRDLVKLYSSGGYEVHICTGGDRKNIHGFDNIHSYYLIRKLFTEFIWPMNFVFVVLLTLYLIYLQKKFCFSVIIPQDNYLQGLAGTLAGKLTGCPTVVMDHGVATNISDKRWQVAWKERHSGFIGKLTWPFFQIGVAFQPVIFRSVCKMADRFFYAGYELDEFYGKYGVDNGRIMKYEHLIDEEFYSPLSAQREIDALRDSLGIPVRDFVINCTSRINFEKGYPQIVAAFKRLTDTVGRDVTLAIAGDTGQVHQTRYRPDKEKQHLLDFLSSEGLMPNVRFLGVLDSRGVRDLNQVSDVHLYAGTMSCSFSLCVLEAMSCAVPCIVTPIPRKQLDVVTPDLGWVVPPGDSEPLAQALIEAYNRRSELRAMGLKAREYVLKHNTYAAMRKLYEEAITCRTKVLWAQKA